MSFFEVPPYDAILVWHDHVLVGVHDARCEELAVGPDGEVLHGNTRWFRRHDAFNTLAFHEDGKVTLYQADEWSGAGLNLPCAYTLARGPQGCPRCWPEEEDDESGATV